MLKQSLTILGLGLISQLAVSSNTLAETDSSTAIQKSSHVIAQVEEFRENSTTVGNINFEYQITDVWDDDAYRIEIDLTGVNDAEDWMASINIPENHIVVENYGILMSQDNSGSINIAGDEWNRTLLTGDESKGVIIVKGDAEELHLETISFDEPVDPNNNIPLVSSFTEEDRQQFRDDYIAQTPENSELTEPQIPDTSTLETDSGTDGFEVETDSSSDSIETDDNSQLTEPDSSTIDSATDSSEVEVEADSSSDSIETEASITDDSSTVDSENEADTPTNLDGDALTETQQQGTFAYGEVLQKSFLALEANRAGPLTPDNRIPWRGDSTPNDGADNGVDLTGGYFDAGDHIIFGQPQAFSMTMLAWGGVDYKDAYQQSGQLDELLEAVKWGTDWMLKAHEMNGDQTERLFVQVGDAEDHQHWVPPEEIANRTTRPSFYIDQSKPGSDVAASSASALASASMLFEGIDDDYSAELITNAIALFDFAEEYPAKYSDSVPAANPFYTSWSGYWDELSLASAWLYRATGDQVYLQKAEAYFDKQIKNLGDWSYATDEHSYAAAALLAKESSNPEYASQIQQWLNYWVNGESSIKYSPGGFAHRNEWASSSLTLGTAYIAEFYNDYVEPNQDYSNFATNQLDYLLGNNPANFSYVIGFGDNYPQRPHHRGSAGSVTLDAADTPNDNILYGALVGGLSAPDDFAYNDRRDDWITNEVGTSYNAPLSSAAIQQYENFGGDPLPDEELLAIIGTPPENIIESDFPIEIDDSTTRDTPTEIDDSPSDDTPNEVNNTPTEVSDGAIKVDFENQPVNQVYGKTLQSNDWQIGFSGEDIEKYSMIVDEEQGNRTLQITYPSDTQVNTGAAWNIPPQKEYYLSYRVRFDENFDFDGSQISGGKLPGLAANGLCSGGAHCDGTNGFTSRYMWRENGKAVLYLYHMDKPGQFGEDISLGTNFQRGKWHTMTQRVRINDQNQPNGEIDVWMDGQPVLSLQNLRFVNNGQNIDTMYFSTFHGGSGPTWWPDQYVHAKFDDFIVSPNPSDVGL